MRGGLPFIFVLLVSTVWSQSVQWRPIAEPLIAGQSTDCILEFSRCQPEAEIDFPSMMALRFTARVGAFVPSGTGGVLTCAVRAVREGEATIPAFHVQTSVGDLLVPALTVVVDPALIGENRVPLDRIARSAFELPTTPVWAGEVFTVIYTLDVDRDYFYNLNGAIEWAPAPLVTEEWSKPELTPTSTQSEQRTLIRYRTRAVARDGSALRIPALQQSVILKIGMIARGAVTEPKTRPFTITTAPARVRVRPLPDPIPADFSGIVGEVKLSASVSTLKAVVGEPFTWSVTLEGLANWQDVTGLPPRSVAKELKTVPSTLRRESREGSLFNGSVSEDLVLVATKPGAYSIGPAAYTVFDSKLGKFAAVTAPATTIEVEPASAAALAAAAKNDVGEAPGEDESAGPVRAAPVVPRDPIAGEALAAVPLTLAAWLGQAAWMLAGTLVGWFAFAFQRALHLDPARAQRKARARMRKTLRALSQSTEPRERFRLLRRWQCDAAILWKLKLAVPTTDRFDARTPWRQLWFESNTLLYAEHPGPADDWARRALVALREKRIPGFSPLKIFLRQNLFPLLALLVVGGALAGVARLRAAEPAAVYRRGDFAAAEAAWRGTLRLHPNDWAARYNLSLALAQRGRWDEAVAQAAAAFVQHPGDASVRWQLELTAKRASYRPEIVENFIEPGWPRLVARQLSPSIWQKTALFALGASAFGFLVLLAWAYGHLGPGGRLHAHGLMVAGGLGLCVAGFMLVLYGPLGRANAAVVWRSSMLRSVPIEGEIAQETSPVAAGAVVLVTHNFLGWSRLAFAHGETGWMRSADLVPLWSKPADDDPLPAAPRS